MSEPTPKNEVHPVTVPGIYAHYKGGLYRVVGTALNSETREQKVIYISLEHGTIWERAESMFNETVEIHGVVQPRFRLIRALLSPLVQI
jgi:hypothetical protein